MSAEAAVKFVTETPAEEIARVKEWINTEEYKEKNFARTSLVINPAHACQPDSLAGTDTGGDFNHQLFGFTAQIIGIGPPPQGLLGGQIQVFFYIGTVFGKLDAAYFLEQKAKDFSLFAAKRKQGRVLVPGF